MSSTWSISDSLRTLYYEGHILVHKWSEAEAADQCASIDEYTIQNTVTALSSSILINLEAFKYKAIAHQLQEGEMEVFRANINEAWHALQWIKTNFSVSGGTINFQEAALSDEALDTVMAGRSTSLGVVFLWLTEGEDKARKAGMVVLDALQRHADEGTTPSALHGPVWESTDDDDAVSLVQKYARQTAVQEELKTMQLLMEELI